MTRGAALFLTVALAATWGDVFHAAAGAVVPEARLTSITSTRGPRMIIDSHGHYTTVPPGMRVFRALQISNMGRPAKGKSAKPNATETAPKHFRARSRRSHPE